MILTIVAHSWRKKHQECCCYWDLDIEEFPGQLLPYPRDTGRVEAILWRGQGPCATTVGPEGLATLRMHIDAAGEINGCLHWTKEEILEDAFFNVKRLRMVLEAMPDIDVAINDLCCNIMQRPGHHPAAAGFLARN